MQTGKTSVLTNLKTDKDIIENLYKTKRKLQMIDTDMICNCELIIGESEATTNKKTLDNREIVIQQLEQAFKKTDGAVYAGVDVTNLFPLLEDNPNAYPFMMAQSDPKFHWALFKKQMARLNKTLGLNPDEEQLFESFKMIRGQQELAVDYASKKRVPVFESIPLATQAVKERILS